jgi:hypothetical protein
MPLLEEIFDGICKAKVISTLDLRFGYQQLPLTKGERVKMGWKHPMVVKDYYHKCYFLKLPIF